MAIASMSERKGLLGPWRGGPGGQPQPCGGGCGGGPSEPLHIFNIRNSPGRKRAIHRVVRVGAALFALLCIIHIDRLRIPQLLQSHTGSASRQCTQILVHNPYYPEAACGSDSPDGALSWFSAHAAVDLYKGKELPDRSRPSLSEYHHHLSAPIPEVSFLYDLLYQLPETHGWPYTIAIALPLTLLQLIMVKGGSLAARAVYLMSMHLSGRADQATYTTNSMTAVQSLQKWYNQTSGLWTSTGWWNAGNCLTVLADFALQDPSDASKLKLSDVFSTTFTNAQGNTRRLAVKTIGDKGLVTTTYMHVPPAAAPASSEQQRRDGEATGFPGFINNFYDDEGWWALGLIRAYDVTHTPGYLDMAEHIFDDMKRGTDNTCGGGIWWSKDKKYKNAIANELYLAVAASLANRVTSKKSYYQDIATKQWAWFKGSGMINGQNTINDGLDITVDPRTNRTRCTNNGREVWSYNQGVVLGGLVELAKANGDSSLLAQGGTIASAAIGALSKNGVLHDPCEPNCGNDGSQFKGIFVRNLHYLHKAAPQNAYKTFILQNADSIWSSDRVTQNNTLGIVWSGPPGAGGRPTAGSHSSGMDALVAAMAVS